jgi:hypothetical protein
MLCKSVLAKGEFPMSLIEVVAGMILAVLSWLPVVTLMYITQTPWVIASTVLLVAMVAAWLALRKCFALTSPVQYFIIRMSIGYYMVMGFMFLAWPLNLNYLIRH